MIKTRIFGVARRIPALQLHTSAIALAGHSKWANIRHDKAKNDAKKSREAYAISTRISASVKSGGVDGNAELVTLMEKAKKLNVLKKIVENAVKRGSGEVSGDSAVKLSDVTYEFMGPGGTAFIVEASTDNKTRTIGLVKHALSKFNASMSPCLYLFQRKGEIIFVPKTEDESVDDVLEMAIDIGAEDVDEYKDYEGEYEGERLFRLITDSAEVTQISNNLSSHGYVLRDSKTSYIADVDNEVDFPEANEKGFNRAIEMLDELPELTNYYTNIKNE